MSVPREIQTRFLNYHGVTEAKPLTRSTGLSGASLWRCNTPHGPLCLRRWPEEHPSLLQLQQIHSAMQTATRRGCAFVPEILSAKPLKIGSLEDFGPARQASDETIVVSEHALWELSRWMPGEALLAKQRTNELAAASMHALARLHFAWQPPAIGRNIPPAVQRRIHRLLQLKNGLLDEIAAALPMIINSSWREMGRELVAAGHTLLPQLLAELAAWNDILLPCQWVLRDFWYEHVLFTTDINQHISVSAIVDYGAMAIDTPATDIARFCDSVWTGQSYRASTLVEAYEKVRPLEPAERELVFVLQHSSPLLSGLQWLQWLSVERRAFPQSEAFISVRLENCLRAAADQIGQTATHATNAGLWLPEQLH